MSKGTRREREAVELLQRAGYATYRPATVQYGENDVWGLFDVLAIAPDRPLRAVQVKSNRATGIRAWARQTALWRRAGFRTEYLVPIDGEGWRLIEAHALDSHTTRVDERQHDVTMGDGVTAYLRGETI